MDVRLILRTMRDPAGLPGYPRLFETLLVGTWVLHIAFVHLTLAAAGLAIYSFHQRMRSGHWQRLSIALTKVAQVGVSMLIVLGVAPLLFVQVIYDPQWYTAHILSARWAVAFILTLIIGCLWYAFYYANHDGVRQPVRWYAIGALVLFSSDGLVMHVLSYQSILPQQWMSWYAPNGVVDTSGSSLYAIHWSHFLFIMSLSIPTVGLFLLAYAEYFSARTDYEGTYLSFVRGLGQHLATVGFGISLLFFLAWECTSPPASGLAANPVGWLLAAALIAMVVVCWRLQVYTSGYFPLAGGFIVLVLLAVWREVVRIHYLAPFGYRIADYHLSLDWPSTLLFFLTFLGVGGLVGEFYLTLLYRSGRVRGLYSAERGVAHLGTAAVAVLVVWIAVFFAFGIVIWLRHGLAS